MKRVTPGTQQAGKVPGKNETAGHDKSIVETRHALSLHQGMNGN